MLCSTEVRYYASCDVFSQTIGGRKPLNGHVSSTTSIHLSTASFIMRICASLHFFFVDLIFHTIFLMAQVFMVSFTIVDVTSRSVKNDNGEKGCAGTTRKLRVCVWGSGEASIEEILLSVKCLRNVVKCVCQLDHVRLVFMQ
jgi:hypothetical protein